MSDSLIVLLPTTQAMVRAHIVSGGDITTSDFDTNPHHVYFIIGHDAVVQCQRSVR